MHLLDQRTLGIAILFLLGILVTVKQAATGSILERPKGNLLVQVVNLYNLFFLLVVNPLAAIFLIARRLAAIDLTRTIIHDKGLQTVLEIGGFTLYGAGFLLMAWALITLGRNYQLGGVTPRGTDGMVMVGPYRLIRHPMYSAALCISLGLALLVQSLACLSLFCIYLVLILTLIPTEEKELLHAYNDRYTEYRAKTKTLIPYLY
jgi:protein-S-isoprenylcysteine O-methyltransferase Ste14